MSKAAYIVSAVRTPIGKFGGALADFTHPDLGTIAARAALVAVMSVGTATAQSSPIPQQAPVTKTGEAQRGLALKVVDESGGVVGSAEVTIKNERTGTSIVTRSDAIGQVAIAGLPAGSYEVSVSYPGFKTVTRDHIAVPAQEVITLQIAVGGGYPVQAVLLLETEHPPYQQVLSEPVPEPPQGRPRRRNAFIRFFSKIRHAI